MSGVRCLGFDVQELGQGRGRKADSLALAREEGFGVIIDAKVRANGYVLGTEDRKFLEYATTHSRELQRAGIQKVYLAVVGSEFRNDDLNKLTAYLAQSPVRSAVFITAKALMRIVEQSIRERHKFRLADIDRLLFGNKIISASAQNAGRSKQRPYARNVPSMQSCRGAACCALFGQNVMRYDPDRHHRRSIRLSEYDYSQTGAYFVTVCVHNRECLLGEISDGIAVLSEVGQAVESAWMEIPERFPGVALDEHVMMPNHLHGILIFTKPDKQAHAGAQKGDETGSVSRTQGAALSEDAASSAPTDLVGTPNKVTLGRVLRAFKSLSAIQANRLLDRAEQSFWQRNYYEGIIRDDQEMEQIRAYIRYNPLQWATDTENPNTNETL